MDLLSLLCAHGEWFARFRETLYGDGTFDEHQFGKEQTCDLGQWLTDHEDDYSDLPEYRATKQIHGLLHQRAAYCLALINKGRRREALAETESSGDLRRLSGLLTWSLRELARAITPTRRQGARQQAFYTGLAE